MPRETGRLQGSRPDFRVPPRSGLRIIGMCLPVRGWISINVKERELGGSGSAFARCWGMCDRRADVGEKPMACWPVGFSASAAIRFWVFSPLLLRNLAPLDWSPDFSGHTATSRNMDAKLTSRVPQTWGMCYLCDASFSCRGLFG